jgi:hypothetical protein
VAIIFPVNFQGTQGSRDLINAIKDNKNLHFLGGKEEKFAHTTIANLSPE